MLISLTALTRKIGHRLVWQPAGQASRDFWGRHVLLSTRRPKCEFRHNKNPLSHEQKSDNMFTIRGRGCQPHCSTQRSRSFRFHLQGRCMLSETAQVPLRPGSKRPPRPMTGQHLHYVALHYITLQYITMHYITLHYICHLFYTGRIFKWQYLHQQITPKIVKYFAFNLDNFIHDHF